MKNLITIAAIALCASASFGAPKAAKPISEEAKARHEAFQKMSAEEKEEYVAQKKAKMAERAGGYVRNTKGQEGRVLIANAQAAVSMDAISKSIKKLSDQLRVAIDVENAPGVTTKEVKALLETKGTCAVVLIVDNQDCDIPLLVAPDSRWASVNVAALRDGDIAGRTHKEVLRAFTFLCGGTASSYKNPMVYPITNVKQLDLIDKAELPIDVIMRFTEYLKALGVTPYAQATYRSACRQGWAPQPTNDVQRAIWNEIHAIPDRPITIEFDPKKDK